jgi:hypothetical protein
MLSQCQVQRTDISEGDLPKDPPSPHINYLLTRDFISYPDGQCSPSNSPTSPPSHLLLLSLPTPKCACSARPPIILGDLSPETPRSYLAPVSAACRSMPSVVYAEFLLRVYNSYGGQTCCYNVSYPKAFLRSVITTHSLLSRPMRLSHLTEAVCVHRTFPQSIVRVLSMDSDSSYL